MSRTHIMKEIKLMRLKEAYGSCRKKKLTQEQAAMLLG